MSVAARADCQWPPLNAIEEKYSHTEQVGGVPFTSSYHAWQVPSYQIGSLHCSDTVALGPWSWSLVIGGEDGAKVAAQSGAASTSVNGSANGGATAPLSSLPPLPPARSSPLPGLPALGGLPAMNDLPPLR